VCFFENTGLPLLLNCVIINIIERAKETQMSNFAEIRKERDLKEAAEKFAKNDHRIEDGVLLWNTNDRSPMNDMTTRWLELGLITQEVFDATEIARDEQNAAFFADYKVARANRTPEQIAEEQFEMRAAFGPGVEVVNVITGERTVS
tara:strand:+ start:7222 stop:7662 length:441 start_codon:yes stop_codon:yes gene_type:complete